MVAAAAASPQAGEAFTWKKAPVALVPRWLAVVARILTADSIVAGLEGVSGLGWAATAGGRAVAAGFPATAPAARAAARVATLWTAPSASRTLAAAEVAVAEQTWRLGRLGRLREEGEEGEEQAFLSAAPVLVGCAPPAG